MSIDKEDKDQRESKVWFRLFKVVYYLIFLITLLFVGVLSYSKRPTSSTYIDSAKTIIRCNNGKTYNARINGFILFNYSDIDTTEDKLLKILCEYDVSYYKDISAAQKYKSKIPQNVNYQVEFAKTTNFYGSWKDVSITLSIGFIVVLIVFEVTKRLLLYILIGKSILNIH